MARGGDSSANGRAAQGLYSDAIVSSPLSSMMMNTHGLVLLWEHRAKVAVQSRVWCWHWRPRSRSEQLGPGGRKDRCRFRPELGSTDWCDERSQVSVRRGWYVSRASTDKISPPVHSQLPWPIEKPLSTNTANLSKPKSRTATQLPGNSSCATGKSIRTLLCSFLATSQQPYLRNRQDRTLQLINTTVIAHPRLRQVEHNLDHAERYRWAHRECFHQKRFFCEHVHGPDMQVSTLAHNGDLKR